MSLENKKPHNEEEVTFSEVNADSTHIGEEDESLLVRTVVEVLERRLRKKRMTTVWQIQLCPSSQQNKRKKTLSMN